jgi:Zn-dependent peptidase ImmA (M78 family)/DNA-binding XRE family transcriptional regulator
MIGTRIKQARQAACLSLRQVSERISVSHTAVSKYERDELTPSSTTLNQLAKVLDVTVDYFLRPARIELTSIEYRSHKGFSEQLAARVIADVSDQVERQLEVYDLLPGTLPDFHQPQLPKRIEDLDEIDALATKLREFWKLGLNPIPDLVDTLEERGVIVLVSDVFGANTFSGLSAWAGKVPVIIVSSEWPGDRQRFTACHELGHLMLHGRLSEHIDEEKACDRFAGAFLAPRPAVLSALGKSRKWLDYRELMLLKDEYGLSMGAWLYRAKDCGVLTEGKAGQHVGFFRKRGWHEKEPSNYPSETPRRFPQTVFRALGENIIGESKAMELLSAHRLDLVRLQTHVIGT